MLKRSTIHHNLMKVVTVLTQDDGNVPYKKSNLYQSVALYCFHTHSASVFCILESGPFSSVEWVKNTIAV